MHRLEQIYGRKFQQMGKMVFIDITGQLLWNYKSSLYQSQNSGGTWNKLLKPIYKCPKNGAAYSQNMRKCPHLSLHQGLDETFAHPNSSF